MRKGSGIGFIAVLLAAAIVMVLAARQWLAVAPAAGQIIQYQQAQQAGLHGKHKDPAKKRAAVAGVPDHGDAQAGAALADLPDLNDMKSETDQHAREVAKAMEESGH